MDIAATLESIRPGARWTLNGNDLAGLTWLDGAPMPSQAELDAAWPAVEAARVNAQARAARHADFVAEADPLFMKWQAGEGTEGEWLAKRAEIRDRHPYVEVPS